MRLLPNTVSIAATLFLRKQIKAFFIFSKLSLISFACTIQVRSSIARTWAFPINIRWWWRDNCYYWGKSKKSFQAVLFSFSYFLLLWSNSIETITPWILNIKAPDILANTVSNTRIFSKSKGNNLTFKKEDIRAGLYYWFLNTQS